MSVKSKKISLVTVILGCWVSGGGAEHCGHCNEQSSYEIDETCS